MMSAVITADLVQSSKMTDTQKRQLYSLIYDMLKQIDNDYTAKSEMFRGDSFQCLLKFPRYSLRVALLLRTYIRSLNPIELGSIQKPSGNRQFVFPVWMFDVRLAIGIGSVSFDTGKVRTSDGTAYQLSGRQLDDLKNSKYRFSIKSDDAFSNELSIESKLIDTIISRTSSLQCEVIFLKLQGYNETEIGKMLDINQSAVNQRSTSGSWHAINDVVSYFENLY